MFVLDGDVPVETSPGVYISQRVCHGRVCSDAKDVTIDTKIWFPSFTVFVKKKQEILITQNPYFRTSTSLPEYHFIGKNIVQLSIN